MQRHATPAVLLSLFCLFTTQAAAEPVHITAGRVFLPGIVQGGTMDISGTQGFSLDRPHRQLVQGLRNLLGAGMRGRNATGPVRPVRGDTLANARATLNGVTYPDVDSAKFARLHK